MKELIVERKIYPDITEEIMNDIKTTLKKYDIRLEFLLDDGICFYLPDNIEITKCPGLVYFKKNNKVILTYTENFKHLDFSDQNDKIILSIPIMEDLIF